MDRDIDVKHSFEMYDVPIKFVSMCILSWTPVI